LSDTAKKSGTPGVLTLLLFVIYALLLVGVILFKFPFQYQLTGTGRELNLIPFAGTYTDHSNHSGLDIGEVIDNVLIFVPLGIYVSMLRSEWSFGRRTLIIASTSVAFETIQFTFAIGRADITDVLCNTFGGIAGIGLYALSASILKSRANRVLNIVELVVTAIALAFFAFLRVHSK
jgi:glycopeptide antibiotics resistance protein